MLTKNNNSTLKTLRKSFRLSKTLEGNFAELPTQQQLDENFQQFIAATKAAALLTNSNNRQRLEPDKFKSLLNELKGLTKTYLNNINEQLHQLEEKIKSLSQIIAPNNAPNQRDKFLQELHALQATANKLQQQLPSAKMFEELTQVVSLKNEQQKLIPARLATVKKMTASFIEALQPAKTATAKTSATLDKVGTFNTAAVQSKQTWQRAKKPSEAISETSKTKTATPSSPPPLRKG